MSFYDKILSIEFPAIKSAGLYYFNTPSGLRYEVRFGRRQDNILHASIVFGVVNDKDISSILSLLPVNIKYYFCKANLPRALDAIELKNKAAGFGLSGLA